MMKPSIPQRPFAPITRSAHTRLYSLKIGRETMAVTLRGASVWNEHAVYGWEPRPFAGHPLDERFELVESGRLARQ